MKKNIRELSIEEISEFLISLGEKPFRAKQIYKWLWEDRVLDFAKMTNISKKLITELENNFEIPKSTIDSYQKSNDGTIKLIIKLFDNKIVESVLIPNEKRITLCVSSQVGCSLDCNFCATAKLTFHRNLHYSEIIDQLILCQEMSLEHYDKKITNIVFMGMGEPYLNYKNVKKAVDLICIKNEFSAKRITVSTSGVAKMIIKAADDNAKYNLAISLHSAIGSKRESLMPAISKVKLPELKESLLYWYGKTKSKVTLEYLVLKGVNDTQEDINALAKFARQVPSKVNIIEYNSTDDDLYSQASDDVIERYKTTLLDNKIAVMVRKSKGKDIAAACGQLANKKQ